MSDLESMIKAFREGCEEYERRKKASHTDSFEVHEIYGSADVNTKEIGRIALGNNLDYMDDMYRNRKPEGGLQLIYVDPPFFSKSKYQASISLKSPILGKSSVIKIDAYDDFRASELTHYLQMLTVRFLQMRDLLSDTGCIAVHLDWHVNHYVKIILDEIFGRENFINEIIWNYKSGGSGKRSFARKHDTVLLYGKTGHYKFNVLREKSYNRGLKPYHFSGVEEFKDEKGWYTLVNMKDVWSIDMVGRTSVERTGYATQKPEKLLERIVEACSDEGDLCADFFAGSGSFGAVCERMGRRWILCDESPLAIATEIGRLAALQENTQRKNQLGFAVLSANEPQAAKIEAKIMNGQLNLVRYEAPSNIFRCSEREEVKKFAREDSLSLIGTWSADFAWDGSVHRAEKIFCSGERCAEIPEGAKTVRIAGYDVFGNSFAAFLKNAKNS